MIYNLHALWRQRPDLRPEGVTIVRGGTRDTLNGNVFDAPLDFALLDGPHAYPLPQTEFLYLAPHLRIGAILALDDIQIPSVYPLLDFLKREDSFSLDSVVGRTAFFQKVQELRRQPDGWPTQGMNRRRLLRYSWRDQLRALVGGRL